MRGGLPITLLLLGVVNACGRIGYTPLSDFGDGSAAGANGGAGSGIGGRGGASGGAGAGGAGLGGGSAGGAGLGGGSAGSGGAGLGGGGATASGAGGAAGTGGNAGGAGAACPTGTFGGHTYLFCKGPLSWTDAQTDCAAKGMRLARIDSAAENTWVHDTAFAGTSSLSSTWPWIGGSDQAVLGEWRWSDGTLFWLGSGNGAAQGGLYTNWVAGSPASAGPATDCALLESNNRWNDWGCSSPQPYVCEQY